MTDEAPKLTERQRIRMMRRIAGLEEMSPVIESWLDRREAMAVSRGGSLSLPDAEADFDELKLRLRAHCMTVLGDILVHSLNEDNQIKAAQVIAAITVGAASQPLAATIPGMALPRTGAPHMLTSGEPDPEKVSELLRTVKSLKRTGGL